MTIKVRSLPHLDLTRIFTLYTDLHISNREKYKQEKTPYLNTFHSVCLPISLKCAQSLTHYSPVLLFYTPWNDQKTFRFSDVFRGYRKATPGCNGLKRLSWANPLTLLHHLYIYKSVNTEHMVHVTAMLNFWKALNGSG